MKINLKALTKTEWTIGALTLVGIFTVLSLHKNALKIEVEDEPEVQHDGFAELQGRDQEITTRKGTRVIRDDNTLKLRLGSGQMLELKDCDDCGPDKEVEYYAVDDSTRGILIYRQYYEGDDMLYIAPDGVQYDLPGWPVFSPDGKSFVIVSDSDRIGHSQVDVWTFNGNKPTRVFQQAAKQDDIFRLDGWNGDDKIRLQETQISDDGTFCVDEDVVLQNKNWTLMAPNQQNPGPCNDKQDWLPGYLQLSSTYLPRAFLRKLSKI